MTSLTEFLRFLFPLVPSASEPSAINALRQAAIDLCTTSSMWVVELDPMTAIAGVAEYELEMPSSTRLNLVMSASYDGRIIKPRSHDELDKMYVAEDWLEVTGTPTYYTQFDDVSIRLVPYPNVTLANGIKVRVTLTPTMDATEVLDELFSGFARDIAYGAAATLLSEQDREYSDKNKSAMYARMFKSAIDSATIMANRSRVRAPLRVRYVRM